MADITKANPRFEIELEFVSALANPSYLQYLAVTYPNLFLQQDNAGTSTTKPANDNSDAACFARYLKYLLDYWRKPEYVQYLTHPAATIRNLELLQVEQFRKDVVRPDVSAGLAMGFAGVGEYAPPVTETAGQESDGNLDAIEVDGNMNGVNGTVNVGT